MPNSSLSFLLFCHTFQLVKIDLDTLTIIPQALSLDYIATGAILSSDPDIAYFTISSGMILQMNVADNYTITGTISVGSSQITPAGTLQDFFSHLSSAVAGDMVYILDYGGSFWSLLQVNGNTPPNISNSLIVQSPTHYQTEFPEAAVIIGNYTYITCSDLSSYGVSILKVDLSTLTVVYTLNTGYLKLVVHHN